MRSCGVAASRPSARDRLRLRRAIGVAEVEVERPGRVPEQPAVEAVALVAVGVAVLRVELGDVGVAEGERVALVVVVGLVLRLGVVGLELDVCATSRLLTPDGDSRGSGSCAVDSTVVSVPMPLVPPAPGRCSRGEPRSGSLRLTKRVMWSPFGVVVLDEQGDGRHHLALVGRGWRRWCAGSGSPCRRRRRRAGTGRRPGDCGIRFG